MQIPAMTSSPISFKLFEYTISLAGELSNKVLFTLGPSVNYGALRVSSLVNLSTSAIMDAQQRIAMCLGKYVLQFIIILPKTFT